jgi:hypothetical protein
MNDSKLDISDISNFHQSEEGACDDAVCDFGRGAFVASPVPTYNKLIFPHQPYTWSVLSVVDLQLLVAILKWISFAL